MTSRELRAVYFNKRFSGYDTAQVNKVIEEAADYIEKLETEQAEMKMHFGQLEGRFKELSEMEDTLSTAMIESVNAAMEIRNNAEKEAKEYKMQIIQEAEAMLEKAKTEYEAMIRRNSSTKEQLKVGKEELCAALINYAQKLTNIGE